MESLRSVKVIAEQSGATEDFVRDVLAAADIGPLAIEEGRWDFLFGPDAFAAVKEALQPTTRQTEIQEQNL